ncbi:MAG: SPFH domain-containing protein [Gammaproteobacteria bacterium]
MSIFQGILDFLKQLLAWWFIVEPWEQAVRVRFGKHVRLVHAGVHFKIPFFDVIYKQNVRRRVSGIPVQTLTALDGVPVTIHGSVGYRICDVLKLQQTLHDAEVSVQQELQGLVTNYVVTHPSAECTPAKIIEAVKSTVNLSKYGLNDVDFFLTGYVSNVPTFRLIQDQMQQYGPYTSGLNTQAPPPNAPR